MVRACDAYRPDPRSSATVQRRQTLGWCLCTAALQFSAHGWSTTPRHGGWHSRGTPLGVSPAAPPTTVDFHNRLLLLPQATTEQLPTYLPPGCRRRINHARPRRLDHGQANLLTNARSSPWLTKQEVERVPRTNSRSNLLSRNHTTQDGRRVIHKRCASPTGDSTGPSACRLRFRTPRIGGHLSALRAIAILQKVRGGSTRGTVPLVDPLFAFAGRCARRDVAMRVSIPHCPLSRR